MMRSIWSGAISFGLVNIPIKLNSAVESEEKLNFDMLSKKDLAPIRYARIDTKTEKEVEWKDIVKGYEYTKGKYVVITDEDFAKASPEKSKTIDILQFVKEEEIDPIFYEKPYYLVPDKGAHKSYLLLIKALEQTKSIGLAEFMLRNRVHICALKAYNGVLLLNQMRYQDEIREVPEVESSKGEKISSKDINAQIKTRKERKNQKGMKVLFEKSSAVITRATGSPIAFLIAITVIIIWAVTGPVFHFSDTWQLVINTGTTIITFLMVFVIQQAQNKDSLAIQLKLNELIACQERASNRLIDVEDLSQDELETLKKFYIRLSELSEKENDLFSSHSVDEATGQHKHKFEIRHKKTNP